MEKKCQTCGQYSIEEYGDITASWCNKYNCSIKALMRTEDMYLLINKCWISAEELCLVNKGW